jgi:hypothetical protein
MIRKPIVMLTATVAPNTTNDLAVADIDVRLTQYRRALSEWSDVSRDLPLKMVIVETSGATPSDLLSGTPRWFARGTSVINYEPTPDQIDRGKGAMEFGAIDHALRILDEVDAVDTVYKLTGRYCLPNARRILVSIPPRTILLRGKLDGSWIDSRFIGSTKEVWQSTLLPAADLSDDRSNRWIEKCLASAVASKAHIQELSVLPFSERPHLVGVSGSTGISYGSMRERVRARLLQSVEANLIRLASKKQV